MDPTDQPIDPLSSLGQELRDKVGGEFRRNAEADEFTARKALLRGRDMAAVAYELLSRGDTIQVVLDGTTVRGTVIHARTTLMTLLPDKGAALSLNLEAVDLIEVVVRAHAGGRSREKYGAESFIARLRELELAESEVELFLRSSTSRPKGVIEAVASDHLMLGGESDHFIATRDIRAIRPIAG